MRTKWEKGSDGLERLQSPKITVPGLKKRSIQVEKAPTVTNKDLEALGTRKIVEIVGASAVQGNIVRVSINRLKRIKRL